MPERPIDANSLLSKARIAPVYEVDALFCYELIKSEPTLDYAPVVHAHWIEESHEYYKAWQEAFGTENFFEDCEYFTVHIACSNCLKSYNIMDNCSAGCWKFCPNCGAKME